MKKIIMAMCVASVGLVNVEGSEFLPEEVSEGVYGENFSKESKKAVEDWQTDNPEVVEYYNRIVKDLQRLQRTDKLERSKYIISLEEMSEYRILPALVGKQGGPKYAADFTITYDKDTYGNRWFYALKAKEGSKLKETRNGGRWTLNTSRGEEVVSLPDECLSDKCSYKGAIVDRVMTGVSHMKKDEVDLGDRTPALICLKQTVLNCMPELGKVTWFKVDVYDSKSSMMMSKMFVTEGVQEYTLPD